MLLASLLAALVLLLAVVSSGCGNTDGDRSSGAAAPARPGDAAATAPSAAAGPGGGASGNTPGGTPSSGTAGPDRSRDGAAQVVEAYFREINDASVAGRVADVTGTAFDGCQRCVHDVANTRLVDQRGLHTDVGPYAVSGVVGGEPVGVSATVTFHVELVAVRMLDLAGREAESTAAGPSGQGTAELSLTPNGWRIRTLDYDLA